jgi:hypothetical protein
MGGGKKIGAASFDKSHCGTTPSRITPPTFIVFFKPNSSASPFSFQ